MEAKDNKYFRISQDQMVNMFMILGKIEAWNRMDIDRESAERLLSQELKSISIAPEVWEALMGAMSMFVRSMEESLIGKDDDKIH